MQRYAILCPGQGGQHAAMFGLSGRALLPTDFSAWLDDVLNDPRKLFENRFAQPLVVACGLARWQQLRVRLPAPSLVAGYSVGELTAYGVAAALEMNATCALAVQRAELMDRCVDPFVPQGLLAVSGLMMVAISSTLRRHRLFVAIINDADRLVLGGAQSDLATAAIELQAIGAICTVLPVSVASHTPMLQQASKEFAALLARSSWSAVQTPVLAGTSAFKVHTAEQAQRALVDSITTTIVWQDCMDACAENGITTTLELGPGDALSRMMQARHPMISARSVDAFRSLDAAVDWLLRQIA